jgi:hypothetical protein
VFLAGFTRRSHRWPSQSLTCLNFATHQSSSSRQCIGVAASASAAGPFVSQATDPLVCQTLLGESIDPYPFGDSDGTAFLLWKADGNAIGRASTLFAQGLAPAGLALTGEPVGLLSLDAAWEQPLIENPALVATDRSYALRRWAVGRCTKATVGTPLLASAGDQAGPGGACVVTRPGGDQSLEYHARTPAAIGYDSGGTRSLRFACPSGPRGYLVERWASAARWR